MRDEINTLKKENKYSLKQCEVNLALKDNEMTQAIEKIKLMGKENIELKSEVGTLKVEVKRLNHNKHINGVRLAGKDNEIIKAHTVIDKLNQDLLKITLNKGALEKAIERIRVLEEDNSELPLELVHQMETLKLEVQEFKQKLQTTNEALVSKDIEVTLAYGVIDSFKQDKTSLTDQLATMKSLRYQKN